MSAAIVPFRGTPDLPDPESLLVGAVMALPDKLELIEASGLLREDFRNSRASLVWVIARRMAERRMEVSAVTICSAGVRAQLLSPADMMWLADLEIGNRLTREQALQVADDVRSMARARMIRNELARQVEILDRGKFSPAQLYGALEGITHALSTDFAGDENAELDLLELNEQWVRNAKQSETMLRPTGIRVLDHVLGGGVPRNLWIVQGKPGSGKNALLSTMIRAKLLADPKCRIGLFGLESGTAWLTRRWQALDLGLKQSEIGSKQLTPEEWERKAVVDNSHGELLRRVEVYRHDGVSAVELARRAMRWIFKCGVTDLLIDNLREVKPDPRSRQEYHLQISETIRIFRNIGSRYGVSTGLLVHDVEEAGKSEAGKEKPPHPDKMQGGKDPGARARAVIGIYRKGWTYRATVTKNEMGEAGWPHGPTCEFKFNPDSATFEPEAGRVIDLREEEREEKREARDARARLGAEDSLLRTALLAKLREQKKRDEGVPPEAPKPPEAQASLLEAPQSKKPEPK